MDKINIGFIGGCINNQEGINREDLYYSVLSKLLSNEKTDYHISLGSYLSYDQLPEQTKFFINKKNPDLIFLFIRSFPLLPLQKPIVKYESENNKVAYALHPALFNHQMKWKDKLSKHQSSNDFQFVKKNVFSFRDINLLAGVFMGLQYWTLKYLAHQLDRVKQLCPAEEIKLIIISPPKNPGSILANLLCKHTTDYLDKYCKREQLDFININSFSPDNFEQDKVHFNIYGHEKLAETINDYFKR